MEKVTIFIHENSTTMQMQIPVRVHESQIFQEMVPFLIIKVEIREEFPDSKKYDLLKPTLNHIVFPCLTVCTRSVFVINL